MLIFYLKKWKNVPENLKKLLIKIVLHKVYIARNGSGENFPDPAKKVRIRNPGEKNAVDASCLFLYCVEHGELAVELVPHLHQVGQVHP